MNKKIFEGMDKFSFAKSVDSFDSHISQAIPGYDDLYYITLKASEYFCLEGTNIYDLGCSTGKLITELSQNNPGTFHGIELEKGFFKYYKPAKNLKFIEGDILKEKYEKASLIISLFTIQFLNYNELDKIFKDVYNGLINGGGFIFACKEYSSNGFFQNIKTSIYWQKRDTTGFDIKEQFNKDISLRKQMRLYESKFLISHLTSLGFEVEEIWRNYNFAGYICRKITF